MPKISFEITGEDRDLSAALQRMQKEIAKLEEANKRLVNQSKQAAKEAKDQQREGKAVIDDWVGGLKSIATGYISIQGAMRLVNAELERQNRLQEGASKVNLGAAAAERGYLSNLGGNASQRQSSIQQLQSIAQQRGVPLDQAYRSAGAALGFTQGGIGSQANAAFDVAARFNPYDTEQLTYGLLAAQRLTGSSDPMSNLGFIKSVQDYSPIANTGQLAQNLIPGAAGVRLINKGQVSDAEAASLVNALSDVRVDVTGEESARTAQRLASAGKRAFPEMSTDQLISYAQQNPAAAKKVADLIEEGGTKAAAVSLLSDPSSDAAKSYRASKAGIAAPAQRTSRAEAAIRANESTTVQALGGLDRSLSSRQEGMALGNTRAAQADIFKKRLDEIASQSEAGLWDESVATLGYRFGVITGQDPAETFEASARGLQMSAIRSGRQDVADRIGAIISDAIGRAVRQNATNDLNTHTEGR